MEYLELIENNTGDMVKALQGLLRHRSVASPEAGEMPFGRGVHEAFQYMLDLAVSDGFEVENIDNYGGHIQFGGYTFDEEGEIISESEEVVGVLVHLDVVPEGGGWDFPPYGAEISDGKIFGRGAMDNKGPAVASYFAMKVLKDAGFAPEKKVRLILGLDEETEWKGMERYLQKTKAPSLGFAPDAGFPVIHAEKGILVFELAKKMGKETAKGLELRSFRGGNAANMVADHARAVVMDKRAGAYEKIKAKAAEYREESKRRINVKGIGKSLEITAHGISSHGAAPENGLNAISVMMEFLGKVSFANDDVNEFVRFYNEHIGFETDGTRMGCGLSDEVSGKLVLNVGMIDMGSEAARLTLNIRYPVTQSDDAVFAGMAPAVNRYNLGIVRHKHHKPIYFPADAPLVSTLMDVYRRHTGDYESQAAVIGGGTYARAAGNMVAFGAVFPGDEDLAHKKNEYIEIDRMVLMAKIYADAIYELTKPE
ncbi:MAG: dipeptidase PepV [Clostridiales bacterium]|nr:dipeptidase PepV [Clostridiales bacterium]